MRDERLEATLATHQVEPVVPLTAAHGDRLLEADLRDVLGDLPELRLVAAPRVEDVDLVDRNQLNRGGHAATPERTVCAITNT